jgi:hypothetical protein
MTNSLLHADIKPKAANVEFLITNLARADKIYYILRPSEMFVYVSWLLVVSFGMVWWPGEEHCWVAVPLSGGFSRRLVTY